MTEIRASEITEGMLIQEPGMDEIRAATVDEHGDTVLVTDETGGEQSFDIDTVVEVLEWPRSTPPNVLPCGCVPHETRMRDHWGFYCDTERQPYCNFECPHQYGDTESGQQVPSGKVEGSSQ